MKLQFQIGPITSYIIVVMSLELTHSSTIRSFGARVDRIYAYLRLAVLIRLKYGQMVDVT